MENIQSDEALRIWIINYLSEKLGSHAILRGGMVLRVLGCPRYTNDLDYIFIPFKSKKEAVPLLEKILKEVEGLSFQCQLHSTNARFDIIFKSAKGTYKTQLEISVAENCPSEALSTGDFSQEHQQLPHIVRVMRFDVALAHKLAAWNERRLLRDLYDAYFIFKNLNTLPHLQTLQNRLQKINYAKKEKSRSFLKKMSLNDFLNQVEEGLKNLTDNDLEKELRDSLTQNQMVGLSKKIRVSLNELIEKLRE